MSKIASRIAPSFLAVVLAASACKSEPKPETTVPNPQPPAVETSRDAELSPRIYPKLAPTAYPPAFAIVAEQGHAPNPFVEGNSKEGLEASFGQGVRHVEVDFVLTSDGVLVSAASEDVKGTCEQIDRRKASELTGCKNAAGHHLATLPDVLAMEFDYVFVDLEPALHRHEQRESEAIDAVVEASKSADRKARNVVVILPRISPVAAKMLNAADLAPGVKGYPKSDAAIMDLVQKARDAGFEMVHADFRHVDPDVIEASAELGVWLLASSRPRTKPDQLRPMAEAGAGGLVTRKYRELTKEVAPAARRLDTGR